MRITDVHSHRLSDNAIVNIDPQMSVPEGTLFSAGVHPWFTDADIDWGRLGALLSDHLAVAIGETGLDALRGADMAKQRKVFERHIDLSEQLGKPLILHCVRAHNDIIAMHRAIKPRRPWVFHGFRLKPSVAEMLLDEGIYLSIGERFNKESAKLIPDSMLMIETDTSPLTIEQIAERAGKCRDAEAEKILELSAGNISKIIAKQDTER